MTLEVGRAEPGENPQAGAGRARKLGLEGGQTRLVTRVEQQRRVDLGRPRSAPVPVLGRIAADVAELAAAVVRADPVDELVREQGRGFQPELPQP